MTHFLRLLHADIPAKSESLATQIAALNTGQPSPDTFIVAPADFKQIPGSPFAYWVSARIRRLFVELPQLASQDREVRIGDHPSDDFRYLRLFSEVPNESLAKNWFPYQKGGEVSPHLSVVVHHLL